MIDLHTHSTFSDGSLTPAQLVEQAAGIGLRGLALTDHDTTQGLAQFLDACRIRGITGVPGVEISADIPKGTMHLLGYHVERDCAHLESALVQIRDGRQIRNRKILEKLNAAGFALTWDEVVSFAGEDVVGRPHFALAMVARGYVANKDEAFDRYLAKGKPGYVDRFRLFPKASIEAIRAAGGIPVLSHPFTLNLSRKALRDTVSELKAYGLAGVEAFYSEHTPDMTDEYLALARDLGLIATGGSDFHGELNPDIRLGSGFGSLRVPDGILEDLARLKANGGYTG